MQIDQLLQNTLKLLKAALNTNIDIDFPDLTRWPEIEKELESQAVLPLVSDLMMGSDISETEKCELTKKTAMNVRSFHKLMKAQTALLGLLESHHIPAVIMKGAAAAQYYPKPSLRCYGDMDVLVLPEDYQRAFDLLLASGYQNLQDFDAPYARHIQFETPEGMEVELHRYFSSSGNEEQNTLLDGWLYDTIRKAEKIDLQGYPVSVFPRLENGLILLGHINQHLSNGLGFRQIVDWMLYVRQELDDAFWETQFKERAEDIGMAYLAKTVTRMCQIYLGLTSEITWCVDADEALAEDLMRYILEAGNFGCKLDKLSVKSKVAMRHFLKPRGLFRYLDRVGSIHMQEAGFKPKKYYAWLYQIGHLIRKGLKRNKQALKEEMQTAAKEANLLKRLKVTRM